MAFPALAAMAGGAALKAGIGGLQNLAAQKEEEERQRRSALKALSSKVQASTGGQNFETAPEIQKAPGVFESVVAPVLTAGAQSAAQGLAPKKGEDEDWYRAAARGYLGGR